MAGGSLRTSGAHQRCSHFSSKYWDEKGDTTSPRVSTVQQYTEKKRGPGVGCSTKMTYLGPPLLTLGFPGSSPGCASVCNFLLIHTLSTWWLRSPGLCHPGHGSWCLLVPPARPPASADIGELNQVRDALCNCFSNK